MRFAAFLLIAAAAAACGNAEIIAPETLGIVDTYPGNGSLVAAEEKTIAVTFSLDVDPATLAPAIALEETGAGAVRPLTLTFKNYDAATNTATFESEPLKAESTFALTISKSTLRAKSGASLRSDVKRTFRTTRS
jgi:hypothetical protein